MSGPAPTAHSNPGTEPGLARLRELLRYRFRSLAASGFEFESPEESDLFFRSTGRAALNTFGAGAVLSLLLRRGMRLSGFSSGRIRAGSTLIGASGAALVLNYYTASPFPRLSAHWQEPDGKLLSDLARGSISLPSSRLGEYAREIMREYDPDFPELVEYDAFWAEAARLTKEEARRAEAGEDGGSIHEHAEPLPGLSLGIVEAVLASSHDPVKEDREKAIEEFGSAQAYTEHLDRVECKAVHQAKLLCLAKNQYSQDACEDEIDAYKSCIRMKRVLGEGQAFAQMLGSARPRR